MFDYRGLPLVNEHSYGNSTCLMVNSTTNFHIFNSFVELPIGKSLNHPTKSQYPWKYPIHLPSNLTFFNSFWCVVECPVLGGNFCTRRPSPIPSDCSHRPRCFVEVHNLHSSSATTSYYNVKTGIIFMIYIYIIIYIWWFPEIRLPLIHPFELDFPSQTIHFGVPLF